MSLDRIEQQEGRPQAGKSLDGHPITIDGKQFSHGVGTHARSRWRIGLKSGAARFYATVGIDDETNREGSVEFQVWVDGRRTAETGVIRGGDKPQLLEADLTGAKEMVLVVTNGGDDIVHDHADSAYPHPANYKDHADWADAKLTLAPGGPQPESLAFPPVPPPILAADDSPLPAINGPRVVGATPGRPFLFRVPATGQPPLSFQARNLPEGLNLDSQSGIISGSLRQAGTTTVELRVKNARGAARRKLTIVGGLHKLALTPPMGWNSWNCWAHSVNDKKIREAADAMVSSGLAARGYQYINIDDTWAGKRDDKGEIHPNEKFPDMKSLGDYIHSKGLKFGVYSSPGPQTCAGYEGSFNHEKQDAQTWAAWGVDYIKYDWCSYSEPSMNRANAMKPYQKLRGALDECDRDIVLAICEYGMERVWEWGAQAGGNAWRTTSDTYDSWENIAGIGFNQDEMAPYARPGHWNDCDMLVVGTVGWSESHRRATRLLPHEQVTHITLWSLLASPLLIGCDMTAMDDFTFKLLTNPEVIDVDQDPLGTAARRIRQNGSEEVWARPLFDGTRAVGLFNRGTLPVNVCIAWKDLGFPSGQPEQPVRDLWQRKDLGEFNDGYETVVQPHGAVLLRIGRESTP